MRIMWDKDLEKIHAYEDDRYDLYTSLDSFDPRYAQLASVLTLLEPTSKSRIRRNGWWYAMTSEEFTAVTSCDKEGA